MKTIPDHLSPGQAWERMVTCSPLPIVTIPLEEALDHCLAEEFLAHEDVPVANRSFMDGFAVRAEDLTEVPVRVKLIGEVLMGEISDQPLDPGDAMAIPTGGYLPEGADAVVMQEDTEVSGNSVVIKRIIQKGDNVQARAEDFHNGDRMFHAGHRLRPQDLSAIATFGVATVSVYRRPTLGIVSTGNELIPFDRGGGEPGKIRETNALALDGAARKFGFKSRRLGIIRDELEAQRAAMQEAIDSSDVVLVSGGSSVGERDFTLQVIRSFEDSQIHFHGLAIRPGNPTIFASIGSRFVFGLPGQPVSSLIVFYQFALPFLFHLAGESIQYEFFHSTQFRMRHAFLAKPIRRLKLRTDYVRLRLEHSGGRWRAFPLPGKSASLSTLAMADGYCIVLPGEDRIPEDTEIKVILFP